MLTKITPVEALNIFDKIWKAIASSIYCKVDDELMRERVRSAIEAGKLQTWMGIEEDKLVGVVLTTFVYQAVEQTMSLLIYAAYIAETESAYIRKNYNVLNRFAAEADCTTISFYTNNQKLANFAQRLSGHLEYHLSVPVIKEG